MKRWLLQRRLLRELGKVETDLAEARSHVRRILAMFL